MFPTDGTSPAKEEVPSNVVDRVEFLMKHHVGGCLNGLRQAWFGEYADRLVAVRCESLVEDPEAVIMKVYECLGERTFSGDFDNLQYSEPDFDESVGLPGLHSVRPKVEHIPRRTILPPDLFAEHNRGFWDMPGQNPRGVCVL